MVHWGSWAGQIGYHPTISQRIIKCNYIAVIGTLTRPTEASEQRITSCRPEYHSMSVINLSFAIWAIDKVNNTHTMVFGPAAGNTLFTGFGGPCQSTNDGDVITLYDPLADRWLMSQFALPNYPNGPFYQCIAISKTGDPTGAYWRYQYTWQGNKMNDYPKFGVWPDAYYMTANQFASGSGTWAGAGVAAFNRAKMMAGDPTAEMVSFDLYSVDFGLRRYSSG